MSLINISFNNVWPWLKIVTYFLAQKVISVGHSWPRVTVNRKALGF